MVLQKLNRTAVIYYIAFLLVGAKSHTRLTVFFRNLSFATEVRVSKHRNLLERPTSCALI